MDGPRRLLSDDGRLTMSALQEAFQSLESPKVALRKDGIERLSSLVSDPDRMKVLDQNQFVRTPSPEQPVVYRWKDVFHSVEAAFLSTFEKQPVADSSNTKQKQILDLLQKVIVAANRRPSQPNLDSRAILKIVKRLLIIPGVFDAFSQQAIEIINHYLSIPVYVACTKGEDWKDFLVKFVKILCSHLKKKAIPPQFLFEVTLKALRHASNFPEVISLLRTKVLNFFTFNIGSKNVFQERSLSVMEGFIQMCRLNAAEARGILCTAGDLLIAPILRGIETPEQQDKACEVFLMILKLHAPYDMDYGRSFFPVRTKSWGEIIESLFNFCKKSIEEVASKRKLRNKHNHLQIPEKLLTLSVKCTKFYKIDKVNTPILGDDENEEPSAKKQKMVEPFDDIVDSTIKMSHGADQLTWLTYIGAVLSKYPYMIGEELFRPLLKIGKDLLTSGFIAFPEVFWFLRSLIHCERFLLEHRKLNEKHDDWDDIWDILVKSFSVREATTESLELLQQILLYHHPKNVGSILELFANNYLHLNLPSLNILREYLICCNLPPSISTLGLSTGGVKSSARLTILKWLLPTQSKDINTDTESIIPTLIFGLLVQRTNYVILTEYPGTPLNSEYADAEDFEDLFLRSTFVKKPENVMTDVVNIERKMQANLIKGAGVFSDPNEILLPFLEFLDNDWKELPVLDPRKSDIIRSVHHLFFRVKMYLSLLNLQKKFEIHDDIGFESKMLEFVGNSLENATTVFKEYLLTEPKLNRVAHVLCLTNTLLNTDNLCDDVKQLLAQKFPRELVDTFEILVGRMIDSPGDIFDEWSSVDDCQVAVYGDSDSPEDGTVVASSSKTLQKELIALEALRCMCHFSVISEDRYEILTNLTELFFRNPCISHFYFDMCFTLIHTTHSVFNLCDPELVGKVIELVQVLCQRYHTNVSCSIRLWQIFEELIPLVRYGCEETRFMVLVGNLANLVQSLGVQSCLAYLKMMEKLAQFDRELMWSWFKPRKTTANCKRIYPLLELHTFLNSKTPCHQIRLAAVDAICGVFGHLNKPLRTPFTSPHSDSESGDSDEANDEQLILLDTWFKSIQESVYDMFITPVNLLDTEKAEEGVNCVSIALLLATGVSFSSAFMEQPGLYFLMEMVSKKGIKPELAVDALEQASPHAWDAMKICTGFNLDLWFRDHNCEEVPYHLFQCDVKMDFYRKYTADIVVILSAQNKQAELDKFAEEMETDTLTLLRENFVNTCGMLMAKAVLDGDILCESDIMEAFMKGFGVEFPSLLQKNLMDLVGEFITFLSEREICKTWSDTSEVLLPEILPCILTEEEVKSSWSCLQILSRSETHVVKILARNHPQPVYKFLLSFASKVHEAHNLPVRLWRLHQFSFYVNALTDDELGCFVFVKPYMCHFVIHAYLRFLTLTDVVDVGHTFLQFTLLHLTSFVTLLIESDPEDKEMSNFYRLLIYNMILLNSTYPDLQPGITKLLDILLVDNHYKFAGLVPTLDRFPDDSIFKQYQDIVSHYEEEEQDFSGKLQSVVSRVKVSDFSCTKETMQYVCSLLGENKTSVAVLVKELAQKRFKDQCTDDLIHSLIHLLVTVINTAQDDEIRRVACKCLGEIGPIDLSLVVLPQYGEKYDITESKTAAQALLKLVSKALSDSDIKVVATASRVLENLLKTNECADYSIDSMCDPVLASLLTPFRLRGGKTFYFSPNINVGQLQSKIEIDSSSSFSAWISNLTCSLIDCTSGSDLLLSCLKPLCELKTGFCEEIFPYVVHCILSAGRRDETVKMLLSQYFCNFFSQFVAVTNEESGCDSHTGKSYCLFTDKSALRCLIHCVQYLREHDKPEDLAIGYRPTKWESNFWLDLVYLDVAKAARFCGAYLTSILFSEIHAFHEDSKQTPKVIISPTVVLDPEVREDINKLQLKAYTSIGESDGVYGCGSARYKDFSSQIQHLQYSNCWNQVLSSYDNRGGRNDLGICVSMKNLGLYNTLWTQFKGIESRVESLDRQLSDVQYECGWRLSHWDINSDKVSYVRDSIEFSAIASGSLQQFVYEAVRSSVQKNTHKLEPAIQRCYKIIMDDLQHANLESSENLYGLLSQLQMIHLIEDYSTVDESNFNVVDEKWRCQYSIDWADFQYVEPILSVKKVMLRALFTKTDNIMFQKACDDALFHLVEKARDSGRLELAEKYALELSDSDITYAQKNMEIAKNHKARGNVDIASHILENLLKTKKTENTQLHPMILLLQGKWLFQSVAERPSVIFQQYFEAACTLCEENRESITDAQRATSYITLAEYADSQFKRMAEHINSDLFRDKQSMLQKSKEDQQRLSVMPDPEARKSLIFLKKQHVIDNNEVLSTIKETKKFQLTALENYLKGLQLMDEYDMLIFRVIALWLEPSPGNVNISINDESDADKKMLEIRIAPHKFIGVLHQLSGRLGTVKKKTIAVLDEILTDCARSHRYHTLPVILSQALLYKDKDLANRSTARYPENGEDRVTAARKLLDKLSKPKEVVPLRDLIRKMEAFWMHLVSTAYFKDPNLDPRKDEFVIPASNDVLKTEGVPVPTLNIPVNPSGVYNPVFIKSFSKYYKLVGGINAPKKVSCKGSDGKTYQMLLKGNDDLRQDAVMQQVFGVMNQLLERNPTTKKKRLLVRTYKVVPVSQRSGVIEWCEDSQTLGEYLVGTGRKGSAGAHGIYRPNDYHPMQCREMMLAVKDSCNNKEKRETFQEIMKNFKPVFHHFFFERFKDAGSFFERRLAYTRSVATSSIVGYILGLGDRHVANIMIDNTTAEVIHVDFGVAFEQGRLLPTPELIPFRLTRDLVDGMGSSGVEGVFRRSCESTMEVLRENADVIITILEVLLYDPLYLWTLSEERKHRLQGLPDSSSGSGSRSLGGSGNEPEKKLQERNNTAARELRRLRSKLAGIPEGSSSGSSLGIPGHVAHLIHSAMDINYLSRLFPGWQPYV